MEKVVISTTTGCKLSMIVGDQEEALACFTRLTGVLIERRAAELSQKMEFSEVAKAEGKQEPEEKPEDEPEDELEEEPEDEPEIEPEDKLDEPKDEPNDQEGQEDQDGKYKGFIHFRCPGCGEITDTCLRKPRDTFQCPHCGKATPIKDMRRARFYCEDCEKEYWYHTNFTQTLIQTDCINCGAPMSAFYDKNRKCYL